jgi:hypothetical protein
MDRTSRTIDWRTAGLIVGAALLGAAWAAWNLARVGGSGEAGASSALVWAVFATPFFTFLGWIVARRREGWLAAFVCFCIYFFGILVAARIERLLLDEGTAAGTFHALYFRLTLLVQTVACVVAGAQRSLTHGTMTSSTES